MQNEPNPLQRTALKIHRRANLALLLGGAIVVAAVIYDVRTRNDCGVEHVALKNPYAMMNTRLDGVLDAGDYPLYDPPAARTATYFSITPISHVVVRGIAGCEKNRMIMVSVPFTAEHPLLLVDEDKPDGFKISLIDRELSHPLLPPHTLTIQPGSAVTLLCDGRRWTLLPSQLCVPVGGILDCTVHDSRQP